MCINRYGRALVLLLLGIVSGCGSSDQYRPPTNDAVLRLAFTPDTTEDAPVLGRPENVTPFGDAVVIPDAMAHKLHFYAFDGTYIRSIGDRGPGPGEFQELTDVFVVDASHLAVTDWRNARASLYDRDGNLASTIRTTGHQYVRNVQSVGTKSVMAIIPLPSEPGADRLFHPLVFGDDSLSFDRAFGDIAMFGYEDETVRRIGSTEVGTLLGMVDGSMIYIPKYYDGYIFRIQSNDDDWNYRRIELSPMEQDAVEVVLEPPFEMGYVTAAARGKGIAVRRESRGAWLMESGDIYNFVVQPNGDEYVFGIEIIDPVSETISSFAILDTFQGTPPSNIPYYGTFPQAKSDDDVFFFVEYVMDGPTSVNGYRIEFAR